jgi:hypothetical protein
MARINKLILQQKDFYEIDKFLRNVERGLVDELSGEIVSINHEYGMYSILSAMEEWIKLFNVWAGARNLDNYDDKPMRVMIEKLKSDELLNISLIQNVKLVVERQRRIYMSESSVKVGLLSGRLWVMRSI